MMMGVFLYSFVNLTRWQGSMPRPIRGYEERK